MLRHNTNMPDKEGKQRLWYIERMNVLYMRRVRFSHPAFNETVHPNRNSDVMSEIKQVF